MKRESGLKNSLIQQPVHADMSILPSAVTRSGQNLIGLK